MYILCEAYTRSTAGLSFSVLGYGAALAGVVGELVVYYGSLLALACASRVLCHVGSESSDTGRFVQDVLRVVLLSSFGRGFLVLGLVWGSVRSLLVPFTTLFVLVSNALALHVLWDSHHTVVACGCVLFAQLLCSAFSRVV
eukprot:TRINITY_DN4299_c0_g1_i3.p1 TRINITY_DN4299_c0_g1~~TRINITY_DN4299_c0_g1_i3.p1  ORF type:complete len:141 (-),score=16.84 TRINITY_DN4299_c0_g1_i3:13-435(-)